MAHGVLRWLPLVLMVPPSLPFGRLRQLRQLRAHHLEGAPCFDSSDQCRRYAQEGQCESDPSYMGRECSQSCGLCDGRVDAIERDERAEEREFRSRFTGCTNNHASCASWARSGECEANPSFMSANCRASCAECESAACHDLEVGCSARAAKGECASNYTLLASCPFSCKVCGVEFKSACKREKDMWAGAQPGTIDAMFREAVERNPQAEAIGTAHHL